MRFAYPIKKPLRLMSVFSMAVFAYFVASFVRNICLAQTRENISNLSGFDFEVTETDCDTLGNDSSVSVFAFQFGRTQKELLFRYGPAGDATPTMLSTGEHAIRLSIPRVSDIIFCRNHLEGLSVDYEIGTIDYPTSGPMEAACNVVAKKK
jgi:hypothetical protein